MIDHEPKLVPVHPASLGVESPFPQPAASPIELLSIDDILKFPEPTPLIRGIINQRELGMLYGQPGSMKTFVTLSMAFAIAGGTDWAGRRVEQGTVVYIALEGIAGFRNRIPAALGEDIPDDVREHFFAIGHGVSLRKPTDVAPLIDALEKVQPVLVIVDTLARAASGVNENDAGEMGYVIQACDAVREKLACAVLLVHHARKEGDVYRGSSAVEGALDTMMRATKDTIADRVFVTVKSEKSKDSAPFDELTFEAIPITLGMDKWGEERTSIKLVKNTHTHEGLTPEWFRGSYDELVALNTVLDYADEPMTTIQLAGQMDVSESTARRRVKFLVEEDYLERRKVSGHAKLFPGPNVPASIRGGAE